MCKFIIDSVMDVGKDRFVLSGKFNGEIPERNNTLIDEEGNKYTFVDFALQTANIIMVFPLGNKKPFKNQILKLLELYDVSKVHSK